MRGGFSFRNDVLGPRTFIISLAMVLVLGFAHVVAAAEELPREATLPLALANKAAAAAQEKCKQDGYRVSVAIVDRAGVLKVLMRGDGAGPHTTNSSSKKAYTAASLRRPTSEMAELVAKTPALQGLRDIDDKSSSLAVACRSRSEARSSARSGSVAPPAVIWTRPAPKPGWTA